MAHFNRPVALERGYGQIGRIGPLKSDSYSCFEICADIGICCMSYSTVLSMCLHHAALSLWAEVKLLPYFKGSASCGADEVSSEFATPPCPVEDV